MRLSSNRSSLCLCLFTQPSITSWTTATTSSPHSSTLSGYTGLPSSCSSPTSGCRLTWRVSACQNRTLASARMAQPYTATESATAPPTARHVMKMAALTWARWKRPRVFNDSCPSWFFCLFVFSFIHKPFRKLRQWFPQWGFHLLVGLFVSFELGKPCMKHNAWREDVLNLIVLHWRCNNLLVCFYVTSLAFTHFLFLPSLPPCGQMTVQFLSNFKILL